MLSQIYTMVRNIYTKIGKTKLSIFNIFFSFYFLYVCVCFQILFRIVELHKFTFFYSQCANTTYVDAMFQQTKKKKTQKFHFGFSYTKKKRFFKLFIYRFHYNGFVVEVIEKNVRPTIAHVRIRRTEIYI